MTAYHTFRQTVFAAMLVFWTTVSASAQTVSVTYLGGDPELWQHGTEVVLSHMQKSLEVLNLKARKPAPRVFPYMTLKHATYQLNLEGGFISRLFFDQRIHVLKLTWIDDSGERFVVVDFKVGDANICAQVRAVEKEWGQPVERTNDLAEMYCPPAPVGLVMLARLVQPAMMFR